MVTLEVKRQGEKKWRATVYSGIKKYGDGKSSDKSMYYNIIDNDPKKIAQILLDLEIIDHLKIYEGVKIYLNRRENKDWLGF